MTEVKTDLSQKLLWRIKQLIVAILGTKVTKINWAAWSSVRTKFGFVVFFFFIYPLSAGTLSNRVKISWM